jgi:Flp pilus assembly protein TadD
MNNRGCCIRFRRRCVRYGLWVVIVCLGCVASLIVAKTAYAQLATGVPTQSEVLKLPGPAQGAQLAEVVRKTLPNRKCSQAQASLEKTFDGGMGGWLVQCEEGQDYWVMMPAESGKAAIALSCIIARATAGVDCYANLRTMKPEYVAQCAQSQLPDRVISACTAIIQSGQAADKPAALAIAYGLRGVAFGKYQQIDLALADFDRAVALSPTDVNARYNRAVALEQKGDFDQAVRDLDEALRVKPDLPLANYERGFVYLKKGDYDHAITDFDQAIHVNPNDAKAYRERGAAYKAKGDLARAEADQQKAKVLDPTLPPVASVQAPAPAQRTAALPTENQFTDADKQAAYCMQASFQYAQRYTRLVAALRENLKSGEALLGRPGLSEADKRQINAQLKSTNDGIALGNTTQGRWSGNAGVFIEYLKRRGLLAGPNLQAATVIAEDAQKDQQAVADTYASCVRLCAPADLSCKNQCDQKAAASEASKRMLQCEQVVTNFK